MKEVFLSFEEAEKRLGHLSAVVVQNKKVFFIHGEAVDLKRDINPDSSLAKRSIRLSEVGAKRIYGEVNVRVVNRP